tara:strand:- start:76441 stop:77172 length:732 start_codon:yes stop_codon:yes gene_type:complete
MGKSLVLIVLFLSVFSGNVMAYVVYGAGSSVFAETEGDDVLGSVDFSEFLAQEPGDELLSAEKARDVITQFVEKLYFRTERERATFLDTVSSKVVNLFNSEFLLERKRLKDEYFDNSLNLLFAAGDAIDAYDMLKNCQLAKQVPIDPLSSIVANTLIQSTPSFTNATVEGVLRSLVYSYYRFDVINKSKRIYEIRLLECQQFDDVYYVERDSEKREFDQNIDSDIKGNTELAIESYGGSAIQG